ncbi:MAG TPA: CoA-binding protein [Acidobacteriota bacterium]|nr:CoA-binding protein [Acidobacteriota bacterium]
MAKAPEHSRVAVLGATPKEDRYSYKAVKLLVEHGHTPVPVHPAGHEVLGITALKSLDDIIEPVDTLTIYVNPGVSSDELDRILRLTPRRVIFNPGAENPQLQEKLRAAGIEVVEACTLVLLNTDQF